MKHNRHMGRLKRNRTADPLLDAAATAGQPQDETSNQAAGPVKFHSEPVIGNMAERAKAAEAEVEALVAAAGWHGPPRGRETVEEHHARWLREKADAAIDQLQREIYRVAAARLDGKEV